VKSHPAVQHLVKYFSHERAVIAMQALKLPAQVSRLNSLFNQKRIANPDPRRVIHSSMYLELPTSGAS
jgi:hypothetical protein